MYFSDNSRLSQDPQENNLPQGELAAGGRRAGSSPGGLPAFGSAHGAPATAGSLPQGELAADGRVRYGAAAADGGGAGKKEADSTKAPKFVKIKEKKMQKLKMVEYASKTVTARALGIDAEGGEVPPFKPMTEKTVERICNCLSWMKLATPEDYSKFKKTKGFTCRVAFCPVCGAFQSRRDGLKLSAMMDAMQDLRNVCEAGRRGRGPGGGGGLVQGSVADAADDSPGPYLARLYGGEAGGLPLVAKAAREGAEFAVLTLTTPNVKGTDLKAEETRFAKGFNDMVRLWLMRDYEEYYLGYVRKLEVTYNKEKVITREMWEGTGKYNSPWKWKFRHMGLKVGDRNPFFGTYNPHYHVILAVTPDFFFLDKNGDAMPVLSEKELLTKWRALMGDPSITQVKIQKAYKVRGEGSDATMELSKYVAKDSDYLYSPKVFRTFYEALKNKKRMTMGGIFQTMHKLFQEGRLDRYIPADETDYKWEIEYGWRGKGYGEIRRVELSPEKAAKVRGMKYSEANDTEDF